MGRVFLRAILLFPVRINPPMLRIRLHLHVALTRGQNGRRPPINQTALAGIGEQWIEK
jgi:hypothetical protein